jgi:hypothetical protein
MITAQAIACIIPALSSHSHCVFVLQFPSTVYFAKWQDPTAHRDIISRFASSTLAAGSPLQSLLLLFAGAGPALYRQPQTLGLHASTTAASAAASSPSSSASSSSSSSAIDLDWRRNLAVLLASGAALR